MPGDPFKEIVIAQIAAARQQAPSPQSPGQRLDDAVRKVAELQIKQQTATEELEKQKAHLSQVTENLAQAHRSLQARPSDFPTHHSQTSLAPSATAFAVATTWARATKHCQGSCATRAGKSTWLRGASCQGRTRLLQIALGLR